MRMNTRCSEMGILMKKLMKDISMIAILLTLSFAVLYKMTDCSILFSFIITFGTISYHFVIRLVIGLIANVIMNNQADYQKRRYRVSNFEMKLYQKMKIKKWKNKMPTFSPEIFDISKHSWDEIAQATCQSEVVHEINVILSFLPLIVSAWVGAFWVFFITSALGAAFDLMFVFMQRFNRTRILKMIKRY